MKKIILIIILVFIVNIRIFSQENENGFVNFFVGHSIQKNAISIDFSMLIWDLTVGGFGISGSYERFLHNMFSVLGCINYSNHDYNYISFELHGRWYPFNTSFKYLFVDIGITHGLFWDYINNTNNDWYIHIIRINAGWKFLLEKGIFIEPVIGYNLPLFLTATHDYLKGFNSNDFKKYGGFGIKLNIGLAL